MRAYFPCLLLALLCATVDSVPEGYTKFLNQHFFTNMNPNSCNDVIEEREIYKGHNNDECKPTNTFITVGHIGHIRNICGRAGEPYPHQNVVLTKSTSYFGIVVCTLEFDDGPRRCRYKGSKVRTRKIVIKCQDGFPVHFGRDILEVN